MAERREPGWVKPAKPPADPGCVNLRASWPEEPQSLKKSLSGAEFKEMALLGSPEPIETAEHILRARRTAAVTRVSMGLLGIVLIVNWPGLDEHPALGVIGFATIMVSAAVQLAAPRL